MFTRVYNDTEAVHALDKSKNRPLVIEDLKKDTVSSDDVLLKVIYAADPVTLLPSGDLQVFMSAEASPEVKDYISKNLMRPQQVEKPKDTGLSVDEMHALTRSPSESRDEYVARMNNYFHNLREVNKSRTKTE